MCFKNFGRKLERKSPERKISASGEFGLLQMVSESDIGRWASEEAEPRRRVDMRQCVSKDAGPQREVDEGVPHQLEKGKSARENAGTQRGMDCEIPHWGGERSILYEHVETSP